MRHQLQFHAHRDVITTLFITVNVTYDNKHPLGIYQSLNPWGDTVGNAVRAFARREAKRYGHHSLPRSCTLTS